MLARREHSKKQLEEKLLKREYGADEIAGILADLSSAGQQSDERFTEMLVRTRIGRGQGPVRIRQELRQCGVSAALIDTYLDPVDEEWFARVEEARGKRFGADLPDDFKERARQSRFLQQRGFSAEQIRRVLGEFSD